MQEIADKDAQGQAPAGQNGGAADPLAELKAQIDALNQEITTLQAGIKEKDSKVQDQNAELEADRIREQELTTRKTGLQQLVIAIESDKQKIDQQRQAADAAKQDAETQLQEVREDLEEELDADYRQEIDDAIKAVTDHITAQTDALKTKQDEVSTAEKTLSDAKAAATKADADLRQAQTEYRGLTTLLQSLAAAVKKAQGALKTAYDAGQTTDAYLLANELDIALARLETHRDPGYEQSLSQKVHAAWTALGTARDATPEAETNLKNLKDQLDSIQKDLKDHTDNRLKKIKEKIEEEDDAPPANGAPAEADAQAAAQPGAKQA